MSRNFRTWFWFETWPGLALKWLVEWSSSSRLCMVGEVESDD